MTDATLLSLIVLGVVAGTAGLYLLLTAFDESQDFARWLGGSLVATGLLPVFALCVDRTQAWPASGWNRWYGLVVLALVLTGSIVAALLVVLARRPVVGWSALGALLLFTSAACAALGGWLSAGALFAAATAAGAFLWRRRSNLPCSQSWPDRDEPLVEPLLASLTAAGLAAALVGSIHASLGSDTIQHSAARAPARSATAGAISPAPTSPKSDPTLRNLRLAHHSLLGSALILATGFLGVTTRRQPLTILFSAGVVVVGLVVSLAAFGGLHGQRTGDWFAVAVLGLTGLLALCLRSWLVPLFVAQTLDAVDATRLDGDDPDAERAFNVCEASHG